MTSATLTDSQQALALQQIRARLCEPNPLHDWPPFAMAVSNASAAVQHIHLAFNLHLFDLASVELLAADWRAVYEGEPDKLKRLEIGFRDLVRAEEKLDTLPEAVLSAEYWKARIPQLPPPLDLRSGNARGRTGNSGRGGRASGGSWRQVKKRASDHHLTASMAAFAVAAGLLARAARRDHFALESRIFGGCRYTATSTT
jgi:pyochelin synthetase